MLNPNFYKKIDEADQNILGWLGNRVYSNSFIAAYTGSNQLHMPLTTK